MAETKHILYVDDDEDDRMLLETILKKYNYCKLSTLENGEALFSELSKTDPTSLPCLIVLDINMPRLSGTEILHMLKEDERYKDLKVVMFTTGDMPYSRITFEDLKTDVIQMKRTIIRIFTILSFLLQACDSERPVQDDIVGKWKSSDGAAFEFNKDGSFTAKSFSAQVVFHLDSQFTNIRFDGSGKWALRKGDAQWEVYLDFRQVSNNKCKSAFPLLIAGKNGVLDNKPPWYLFVWKEEEGGQRYEFTKQ